MITARAGSLRDSVTITISENVVHVPIIGISIDSVVDVQSRQPVPHGNVRGTIEMLVRVETPVGVNTQSVQVSVDGTEVCREDLNGRVQLRHRCVVNTVAHSAGQHTIRAEVRNALGTPVASFTMLLTFVTDPPKGAMPVAYIEKILDQDGNEANPAALRGFIQVMARTDVPLTMANGFVRVKFRIEVVCAEPFAGRQRFQHRCTFDTRRFPNGEARIMVESVHPNGITFTSATSQPLVLAN